MFWHPIPTSVLVQKNDTIRDWLHGGDSPVALQLQRRENDAICDWLILSLLMTFELLSAVG